jgi:hypothetical protein
MKEASNAWLRAGLLSSFLLISATSESIAQQRRYEPSQPTVSPYLQLFRNDVGQNSALPNYFNFVRPLQQQYQVNQTQQRLLQQQYQAIGQLRSNVQALEGQLAQGQVVAPTGKGSWFNRPSTKSGYLNTSRFYSQSGTGGTGR